MSKQTEMRVIALPFLPRISEKPTRPLRSEVVPFGAHARVMPPGTEALHDEHGWVFVQVARGNRRQVIWYVEEAEDECESTVLVARVAWVWVHELAMPSEAKERPAMWQRLKLNGMLKVPDLQRFPFARFSDPKADAFGLRDA